MFIPKSGLLRDLMVAMRRFKLERTEDGRLYLATAKTFFGGAFTNREGKAGYDYGPLALDPNIVVDQGLNYVLNSAFLGQAQVTAFYIGLFQGNYNPVAGLTGANFEAQANEFTAYTAADRPAWDIGNDPTNTKTVTDAGNEAEFVYSAGGPYNIYGAALFTGATKEGGADMCIAATRFASSRLNQAAGDRLAVGYTLAASDA